MTENNFKNDLYEPLEATNWGFNTFSEKINGRVAMMGFILVFFIEFFTKEKLVDFIK